MIGVASAYLSGLFFASFFTDKWGIIMLTVVCVLIAVIAKIRSFSRFDLYIIIFSFLTAFTVNMKYTLDCYCGAINFAGTTGSFSGRVTDYEVYEGDRASYVIDGRINGRQKTKILFYCYETGAEYGDIITLTDCDFLEIENDYLFNARNYYKSHHIFLRVYSAESVDIEYTDSAKIKKALASFRESMINKICLAIGDETGGFLIGMIFGEKQYIDDNTRTALYRSGIGHVLAVSGLHVSIIASIVMIIMKKLKVNKFIGFGIINLLFLIFIALADYPLSAIRAMIMLDIMYSARLFRRQSDALNSIAVAVMIISLTDPYAVYNSGFIMSVSGTFGIVIFGRYMAEKAEGKFIHALIISICTTLCIMPVSLYYSEETSLISPLTNIILVPLCTFAMIFGLIYVITGGFMTFLLYMADIIIRPVIFISNAISSINFLRLPHMNNLLPTMFILSGIIIVCLYIFMESRRIVSVSVVISVFICSAVFVVSGKLMDDNVIIAVLGKGSDAVVTISHNGRTDIIDLSGHYRSAEYVRKYLSVNGINRVGMLILAKNTASQDIVYKTELQPFKVGGRFAVKDIDIYNGRLKLLNTSGFRVDSSGYSIDYSEDMLSVHCKDYEVNFSPAKNSIHTDGVGVYYGNITKNTVRHTNGIYLDEMNNFEIIVLSDGKYIIRRLYGEN